MKSLFTAATGMEAQQTRISVIANNIANINTTGFKASRAEFQDLLYETQQIAGSETAAGIGSPSGLQVGSGVRVVSTQNIMTQGTLEQTGRSLDLSIEGPGFFAVTLPNGSIGYTRSGSLSINSDNKIVTQNGFPIYPEVTVQAGGLDRSVGVDGTVQSRIPPSSTPTTEGQISVFTFPNESGLQMVGRNVFQETAASGTASQLTPGSQGAGTLQSGFLESSNVNIAEELIRMILAQRAYELNSKVIQTSDQVLNSTTQIR